MAATVGRLTGHPAACLSTLGPGATNFSTALAYGFLGGFPMLCITGQKPIRHSKQGAFQIVDVIGHFKEVSSCVTGGMFFRWMWLGWGLCPLAPPPALWARAGA